MFAKWRLILNQYFLFIKDIGPGGREDGMRLLLILMFIIASPAIYADLDGNQQKALRDTQDLLKNPTERQKAINKDPRAKDVDSKAEALAGSQENKENMYGLAAQLMEKIATETNGDPEKMQQLMLEAQQNPQAFYNKYFDANQRDKVRDIANKAQGAKPSLDRK
jgi:hypothetical protein